MKKLLTLLAVALIAVPALCSAQEQSHRSLNDIRFENWTEDDWQDNDYYREIRKYITSFQQGTVRDGVLSMNKDALDSMFIVLQAQPFLGGGLWVSISFLDAPEKIFQVWVYGFVDEEKEEVLGYEVRTFRMLEEQSGFTKEDYLNLVTNHPEIKLW
ncbi:MAG: hypothetical protein IJZ09_06575 [Tidjanibacter sp.]|nr:hypothetical protein [Tidjanibacter sp.]